MLTTGAENGKMSVSNTPQPFSEAAVGCIPDKCKYNSIGCSAADSHILVGDKISSCTDGRTGGERSSCDRGRRAVSGGTDARNSAPRPRRKGGALNEVSSRQATGGQSGGHVAAGLKPPKLALFPFMRCLRRGA